jgi:hypothetical protein
MAQEVPLRKHPGSAPIVFALSLVFRPAYVDALKKAWNRLESLKHKLMIYITAIDKAMLLLLLSWLSLPFWLHFALSAYSVSCHLAFWLFSCRYLAFLFM